MKQLAKGFYDTKFLQLHITRTLYYCMEFIQVSCSATRIDLSKTFCGVPLFLKLNCNSIPHSPLMTIISTSPYISQHKFSNKQTKEENAGRPDTAVHFYAPLPNVVI
jgi:hypothetical protein